MSLALAGARERKLRGFPFSETPLCKTLMRFFVVVDMTEEASLTAKRKNNSRPIRPALGALSEKDGRNARLGSS